MTDEYISAREAASLMGLKYHTLLSRVRRGKIAAKKIGWAILIRRTDATTGAQKNEHRNSGLAGTAR